MIGASAPGLKVVSSVPSEFKRAMWVRGTLSTDVKSPPINTCVFVCKAITLMNVPFRAGLKSPSVN